VPRGFVVESAYYDSDKAVIVVRQPETLVCVHRAEQFPSCGRRSATGGCFPLQFGKKVDDELTIRAQCLEQAVPPPAERLLALGEERADKALEGLAHRRVCYETRLAPPGGIPMENVAARNGLIVLAASAVFYDSASAQSHLPSRQRQPHCDLVVVGR